MLRQLIRKELALQRSSFYFALAIVLVWGVLLFMARQAEAVLIPRQLTMGQLVSLLQAFFIAPCLLVVIPLFSGAGLVAEERRLGVWDWQLSLPAPRALQWALKVALAATLTLGLARLVLPGMDWALTKVLAGRGDPFPLLTSHLALNGNYAFLPLLVMACGAFASSLAADPYKAFFIGLLLTGAALFSVNLVDPAWLFFMPWGAKSFPNQPHIATGAVGIVAALSAIIGFLSYFNFRFEGLRWRRLILELMVFIILSNTAAWLLLRGNLGVGGLVSNQRRDVAPMIEALRRSLGIDQSGGDLWWTGIEPLLAKRMQPGRYAWPTRETAFTLNPQPIRTIYRLPKTNKVVVELNSLFPNGDDAQRSEGLNQIVEVDIANGAWRQILPLIGYVIKIHVDRPVYVIRHLYQNDYVINSSPIPLRSDGIIARSLGIDHTDYARWMNSLQRTGGFTVDGRKILIKYASAISERGDFQMYLDFPSIRQTMLVRQQASGAFTSVDTQPQFGEYAVSSDGKWYARHMRRYRRADQQDPVSLSVFAVDHKTTWTVTNPEGDLLLTDNRESSLLQAEQDRPLGAKPDGQLRVSPSGRFLPLLRTQSIVLESGNDHEYSGYPKRVDVALLDLATGRDLTLLSEPAPRALRERFENTMKDWLWRQWEVAHGHSAAVLWESDGKTIKRFPDPYYPKLPPLMWAPGRDRLAVLYDDAIHFFEYLPDAAAKAAGQGVSAWQAMGGFVPTGTIDLRGFDMSDFDFWDQETLLAWGQLGLFRIDIQKALAAHIAGKAPN